MDSIKKVITIAVALFLLPVLNSAVETANATGMTKVLLDLIPFAYIAGVVYYIVKDFK